MSAQDLVSMEVEYVPIAQSRMEGDEGLRVEDRLGGDDWLPPVEEADELSPEGLDLGLELQAAYEDNIFLSATSPEADFVFKVSPRIGVVAGQRDKEGAYLRIAYRPSLVLYVDNGDDSRVDHRFSGEAAINGPKSSIVLTGNIDQLGDATADVGAQTDRTEYASELRVAWKPRVKLVLELAGGVEGTDYDAGGLTDSKSTYGEFALRYAYSPKTQLVIAVAAGTTEVDGAVDQDFTRSTARLIWQPREKWTIDLEAGVEARDYAAGSDTYPVFDGRIVWQPKQGTELFAGGYLREETSAFFAGQNIEVLGVSAGIVQRIGEDWVGRFEVGYETACYKDVTGTGFAAREDNILFIRPSFEYRVTDHFQMGIYYRYSRNDSSVAGFGYDANEIGVDANYDF